MHYENIVKLIVHAYRQIDQIERRVIHGEKISHNENDFPLLKHILNG